MEFAINTFTAQCKTCGNTFDSLEIAGVTLQHCDPCVEAYDQRMKNLMRVESAVSVKSCVPQGYADFDIQALPEATRRKAEAFVFPWVYSDRGVGLGGDSRIGKSYVIFEKARQMQEDGKRVAVIKDQDMGRMVRENSKQREKLLTDVGQCDLVVWDDFGLTKMTDAVEGTYNDLLETINSRSIPILGTANYGGEATMQKWAEQTGDTTFLGNRGSRMIGRFRDHCDMRVLRDEGEN